jgi:hypothetical protein
MGRVIPETSVHGTILSCMGRDVMEQFVIFEERCHSASYEGFVYLPPFCICQRCTYIL